MTTPQGPDRLRDRQALLTAATQRILCADRCLPPEERKAATELLADLYAASTRHGISPEDWSWVSSLGHDCIDVIKQHALQREQTQRRELPRRSGHGLDTEAGREPDPAGRGL